MQSGFWSHSHAVSPLPGFARAFVRLGLWGFLLLSVDSLLGVRAASAQSDARTEALLVVLGERSDSARLERAVAALLTLEGLLVTWLHGDSIPSSVKLLAPSVPQLVIDLRDANTVRLILAEARGEATEREVAAATLDDATSEAIAQIARSMLLAAPEPRPVSEPNNTAEVRSSAPVPVLDTTPREPPVHRWAGAKMRRRWSAGLGVSASVSGRTLQLFGGVALAAHWAARDASSSPILLVSVARTGARFRDQSAPADASVVIWSARAGVGWELGHEDRTWVNLGMSAGFDRIQLDPSSNQRTATFQLGGTQSAVRVALGTALHAERALLGPVAIFLRLQADFSKKLELLVQDGDRLDHYLVANHVSTGACLGLSVRW